MPDGLDFDRAAGLTVIYGTTLHALKDRAALKSGETLAVLGASGGTGLAAIELGKLMGARVIACASSDDKLAFAKGTAPTTASTTQARFARRLSSSAASRHRRDLRSGRRPLRRAGAALARLGGPARPNRTSRQ